MGFLRLTTDEHQEPRTLPFHAFCDSAVATPVGSAGRGAAASARGVGALMNAATPAGPGRDSQLDGLRSVDVMRRAEALLDSVQRNIDELNELADELAPIPFPRIGAFSPDPEPPLAA